MSPALTRNSLCDKSLSRAGRPVEEDSFRRFNPELLEQLRVTHRELDCLPEALEFVLKAADILVRYPLQSFETRRSLFRKFDYRILCDDDGLLGFYIHNFIGNDLGLDKGKADRDRYRIILDHRKIHEIIEDMGVVGDRDIFWEVFGRGENHPFCFDLFLE